MEIRNKERAEDLLLRVGADRVRLINGPSGPLVTFQRAKTTDNVQARQLRPELVAFAHGAMLLARLEVVLEHYGADTKLRPWLRANASAASRLVKQYTAKHGAINPDLGEAIAMALESNTADVFDAGWEVSGDYIRLLESKRDSENMEVRDRIRNLLAADSQAAAFRPIPENLAEDLAAVAILDDLTDWGSEA